MRYKKSLLNYFLMSFFICFISVPETWSLTAQQIAKNTFPSVVLLVMEDINGQSVSMGSGFYINENTVVTNWHVIEGAVGGYAKFVGNNTTYKIAGTVGIERNVDLVLLSIEGPAAPFLSIGNSGEVQIGDEVYAIGNPLGLEGTFSKGIVSGIRQIGSETIFQLSAPISLGSSGGPVLNIKGQVMGFREQWNVKPC